jgi:hypothetical protein
VSARSDPNLQSLELVAYALEPLLGEFVLVGGCAVGLFITDPLRPAVRHTLDVDLLVEVTTKSSYYQLSDKLRELGFREAGDVICRWTKDQLIVDVMPTEGTVLGFTNRWYDLAAKTALKSTLPSGLVVRHVSPPLFIATKIESFKSRGAGNYLHHDIEDVVNVVDGRPELVDEVRLAPPEVQEFIQEELDDMLARPAFTDRLQWHLRPDAVEQARVTVILERLRKLSGL